MNTSHLMYFLRRFLMTSRPHLLAGVLFFVLTVGMTWPLMTRLSTHVTLGQQPAMTVPYFNLWTLAWNHHWLSGEVPNYWDANIYFPHQRTLAFSEPQLLTSALTYPFTLLGGNTVLAYNIALLGFLFGAGISAYALCWWLLEPADGDLKNGSSTFTASRRYRWISAVTSGILYAFNFYMFREVGVLQLLATLFLPITFLGMHRFFRYYKWSDALLFSIGFLGSWCTCAYYGLFLSVFVPCFAIRLAKRDLWQKKTLMKITGVLILILICLIPLGYGMWTAKTAMSLDRPEILIQNFSALIKNYLKLPSHTLFYGGILKIPLGRSLFLGGILLFLASLGMIGILEAKEKKTGIVNQHSQPLLQQYGVFYLCMALLGLLLSLGMALAPRTSMDLGGYQFLVWLSPYNLLYNFVPGFSSIRSPDRFIVFCILFLSILAGYGMFQLSQHIRPRWKRIVVPILVAAMIFELWPLPLRLVKVPRTVEELPPIYEHLRSIPNHSRLLELPMSVAYTEQGVESEARYMYFSSFHWASLVNGYSGFLPQSTEKLAEMMQKSGPQVILPALKEFNVQYILAHVDELSEDEVTQLKQLEAEGLKLHFREGNDLLYEVDYGNIIDADQFPDIAAVTLYESQKSPDHVTLCFHYQITNNQCVLTTPWQNRIECEVSWYRNVDSPKDETQPIITKQASYQGSKLMTADANTIEIEVPAPPPGEYQVIIRQPSQKKISLICQVHSNGFVTLYGEK